MLENSKDMLNKAKMNKKVVFQFNINNLEWTKYVLEACNSIDSPVILGVSQGAIRYMGGYNVVAKMVESLIEDLKISCPVCLHLDHGNSYESCVQAINAGFTSVMIDASLSSLEENIEITKKVVAYAHDKNISVEGEVGTIGGTEDDVVASIAYAKYEDVLKYVEETKLDSVAPALGSVHGLYKGEAVIDTERMKKIADAITIPLVLHGGSGISDNMLKKCIENGISKINVNTQLQINWGEAIKNYINENPEEYDPRKIISAGEVAIKNTIISMIENF